MTQDIEPLPEGHPIIGHIVFSYWPKPIPTKAYDWCAYLDGYEELGQYGWGATKDEARANLLELLEDDQDRYEHEVLCK